MSPPRALGPFVITGVLGEGGSGVVYAASHAGRDVALKVLRADVTPTARERERFVDEARNMARIDHPGVVKVLDVGELDDGRPYLAMQRLDGVSLAERLRRGPLPPDAALVLFGQLASAVTAMHDAGLVHRDLKPENVMLVDHGSRCMLLDFGIARERDDTPSTTTQAGLQRGTPAYMAPERFFGARATVASDIYELTVTLFVMLCGELPWADPCDVRARLAPRRPAELGVKLPGSLAAALARGLATTPDERPRTVDELAREIRAAASPHSDIVLSPTQVRTVTTDREPHDASTHNNLVLAPTQLHSPGEAPTQHDASTRPDLALAPTQLHPRTTGSEIQLAPTVLRSAGRPPPSRRAFVLSVTAALLLGGLLTTFALRGGDDGEPPVDRSPAASLDPPTVLPLPPPTALAPPPPPLPSPPAAEAPAIARPTVKVEAPRKSTKPRSPGSTPAAPPPPPTDQDRPAETSPLPWKCYREVQSMYCADDFKATEPPSMRGAQCKGWTKTMATVTAITDPKVHDDMEASCRESLPIWRAAVEERKRATRAGEAPWQESGTK